MSASSEVSITYNFHFIQETMSSFSFSLLPTKQWICTEFTHGKYVLKLWKLTGKDDKFYIYTPIYKEVVNRKERPLIIRIKVAHSNAFKRLILLKCTAVNWCPDKNSNNKTNKKTIALFILPSLPRLLLVLHISWHFCNIFVRQGRSKMIFCCFKHSF